MLQRRIIFLNAVAFGIVAPLLYFMIALPDVKWIALLLVFDSLGRICGLSLERLFRLRLAYLEIVNVVSYLLLAVVGFCRPPQSLAFELAFLSRFLGAFASASLPAVRLISPEMPGIFTAQAGLAVGCLISACIGNYRFLPISILVTGGLMVPALLATVISSCAGVLALNRFNAIETVEVSSIEMTDRPSVLSLWNTVNAAWILLACELVYGMLFCVLPLTAREICAFSPLTTSIYFATFAMLSLAVSQIVDRLEISNIALPFGITFSAVGFSGVSAALYVSWKYASTNGQLRGTVACWIAGVFIAMGHGILRASLSSARTALGFKLNWISPLVAAGGAILISRLWVEHERSAFAIPAVILLTALPGAIVNTWLPRKRPEGFMVLTETPSRI